MLVRGFLRPGDCNMTSFMVYEKRGRGGKVRSERWLVIRRRPADAGTMSDRLVIGKSF